MSLHFAPTWPKFLNVPFFSFFKPCDLLTMYRFLRIEHNNLNHFLFSSVSSSMLVSTSLASFALEATKKYYQEATFLFSWLPGNIHHANDGLGKY